MSRDQWERRGTAAAVLIVDAIAATVSFIHIQHLAATHGQTRLAAILLPLSIDGTVAASSLALLRSARAGTPAPWLGQAMLASAVIATLAANVGYGWAWGPVGAAISGWPAYAFIGCTEMAILMVRRTAVAAPAAAPAKTAHQVRGQARIKKEVGVGQPKAKLIQKLIAAEVAAATQNGNGAHG